MYSFIKLLSLYFLFALISCNSISNKQLVETPISTCGVKTTFISDSIYLENYDKPKMYFSIEAPSSLEVLTLKDQKTSYFKLQKLTDGKMDEFMTFGYLEDSNGFSPEKNISRLEWITNFIFDAGYDAEESQLLETTFDENEYYLFQSKGVFPPETGIYAGKMLYNIVLLPYDETKTIVVTMMKRDDENQFEFYDFEDKFCISEVWQSIKLLNE